MILLTEDCSEVRIQVVKKTLLDEIIKENDIKSIPPSAYRRLAKDIRKELVHGISKTGGHLASNLGTVELTMALHLYLDFPKDKLVWDVGHQAYTHKLLTGRKDVFCSLRSFGGISGFPKVSENKADTFDTGHSSTSISVAMGLAKARDIMDTDEKVVAVIGDGALSGGMAFEALNNIASMDTQLMIILNDNKMSISPNVGGMSNYLGKIRTNRKYNKMKDEMEKALEKIPNMGTRIAEKLKRSKDSIKRLFIPGMLFEDMGITYIGPVDGHNIDELLTAFHSAEAKGEPVLVHVITKKGKGYSIAESNPSAFHGVDAFNIKTGEPLEKGKGLTYTEIFGKWMCQAGKKRTDVVGVCAAMPHGTGLDSFAKEHPERFFDVGIAEEHAVTFAAGLAAGGMKPVVCLYSTFLQRAYDQILHDVCLDSLPVIFAVDRSGLVGKDGETHQGIYDVAFLSSIPNLTILSPMDGQELEAALDFSLDFNSPIVIRYPRGVAYTSPFQECREIVHGKAEVLIQEKEILLIGVGSMVRTAIHVYEKLKKKNRHASVVNARFIKPFDKACIRDMCQEHRIVVIIEENAETGCFGQQVQAFIKTEIRKPVTCISIHLPDRFIEHGTPKELREKYGLDSDTIVKKILEA